MDFDEVWAREARELEERADAIYPRTYPENDRATFLQRKLGDNYTPNEGVIEENKVWWDMM